MAQAVTVYRWDDPGAPQINNAKPSEIINVLKKCLVEGYGTKQPLGWALLADDVPGLRIAFQNNNVHGSGGAVQFKSDTGADANQAIVRINACQSWLGFDDFYRESFKRALQLNVFWKHWFVIGTDTAFYFFSGWSNDPIAQWATQRASGFFCGDYIANRPNDAGRFVVVSQGHVADVVENNMFTWDRAFSCNLGVYNESRPHVRLWKADGSNYWRSYQLAPPYKSLIGHQDPVLKVGEFFCKIHIYTDTSETDVVRGELPGLLHSTTPMHRNEKYPLIYLLNNQHYFAVPDATNAVRFYLNTESW